MASEQRDVFNDKYTEFCRDLEGAVPEYITQIRVAAGLSLKERKEQFRAVVLPCCSPSRNAEEVPDYVLPGVPMHPSIWKSLSSKSKKAIQEYLTILSFTLMMESGFEGDLSGSGWSKDWAKTMMDDLKTKLENVDFKNLAEKFGKIFGMDASGGAPGMPQLPEKFLKGQIAKLAEEMLKELKIEDFGLDPATVEAANSDPTRAFQLIMDVFMRNPQTFQGTIQKMTRKLQAKVQSGALRPQELVAEAEELMKIFSENPEFVHLMESFRQSFGFEDPEQARAAGQDGTGRLSIVQARLRKKLEAKKNAAKNR